MNIAKYIFPFLLALSSPAMAWDITSMNEQIDQTNFLINDNCSGTLIDKTQGLILTANHCITAQFDTIEREKIDKDGVIKKEKVRVSKPGMVSQLAFHGSAMVQKNSYVFKIVAHDEKKDLALLETTANAPATLETHLACTDPVRGETAYIVGNPYAVLYSSVTKGIISSTQRNYPMIGIEDQGDYGLTQISSGMVGGNSGGAVYNDRGEMIGVPVRASQINEIIGLAVPLADIKSFLKDNGFARLLWGCP